MEGDGRESRARDGGRERYELCGGGGGRPREGDT